MRCRQQGDRLLGWTTVERLVRTSEGRGAADQATKARAKMKWDTSNICVTPQMKTRLPFHHSHEDILKVQLDNLERAGSPMSATLSHFSILKSVSLNRVLPW